MEYKENETPEEYFDRWEEIYEQELYDMQGLCLTDPPKMGAPISRGRYRLRALHIVPQNFFIYFLIYRRVVASLSVGRDRLTL